MNPEAEFIPILVAEIPSLENGGRAPDGTWTIWRLKQGVVWHDGTPFTADDVLFTWEYATDPATAAVTRGLYENILRIDKLNDHAVRVVFKAPTPMWYAGGDAHILPKHRFAEYTGPNARNAPYNLTPVGTGPTRLSTSNRGMWRSMKSIHTIRPQPPLLRHGGAEGRRGCDLGRAVGDPDRGVRLRLEHAGG